MTQHVSKSITRRRVVAGLALTAATAAVLADTDNAYAQTKQTALRNAYTSGWAASSPSRRWWITSVTLVVKNPIVGRKSKNPQLREWHTKA